MLLGIRVLKDVASVNSFEYGEVCEFTEGDSTSVFFQIVDTSLDRSLNGFNPSGRRIIPGSGAVLNCVVQNIDASVQVSRAALNPFPEDRSIWRLDFFSTDKIRGTSNLKLALVEGLTTTRGLVKSAFRIHPKDTI